MRFPILAIILVLLILLAIRYRSLSKKTDEKKNSFWEREMEAETTIKRESELSDLPYIKVPLSRFQKDLTDDPSYMEIINEIKALSNEEMLNLNGMTNTDLKLSYGRNNLERMQSAGDRFSNLTVLIAKLGEYLFNLERYEDAITVLEFGIDIGTDISKNYTILADCYINTGKTYRTKALIEKVEGSNMVMENAILKHINSALPQEGEKTNFETK